MGKKASKDHKSRGEQDEAMTVHLPEATIWPAALALGSTLIAWGLVSSVVITIAGLILSGVSTTGWIKDIRNERAKQ